MIIIEIKKPYSICVNTAKTSRAIIKNNNSKNIFQKIADVKTLNNISIIKKSFIDLINV
tara:strand:+ start:190 stop:366 length:177 start_codon:yes stop_codon:yes gene_type:complete